MIRKIVFSLFIVSFLLSWTLQAQDSVKTSPAMKAIISYYDAIEAGDTETRIALLAEDVIFMPNHWTITRGKEPVARSFRSASQAVFRLKERQMLHMETSGDLTYTVNSYFYTYHKKGDPEQWHKTKNVHVWRKNKTGQWKLALDIWNSDVPISKFSEE